MKLLLLALCGCLMGTAVMASPLIRSTESKSPLLGANQCTWGPSYWCSNITNAKSCHAVTHCIQSVWETHTVPEDNDSICKICLDMVDQARDQLQSNETQEDLKAVFEGSCNLIPIKLVKKECCKLADDFIPELIEALASQMNSQAVCSVAGLCNNVAIDKMLAELPAADTTIRTSEPNNNKALTCEQCNTVGAMIAQKFRNKDRDDLLDDLLRMCGELSSLSDGCSNIMITYFNEIYNELSNNLNADSLCHMSGVCAARYHQHPEIVEIQPKSEIGVVVVKDDIPCELCEQLVRHLRDLLVANTTETEFKSVLEGLCSQTKSFKSECMGIVDQYYEVIYTTLMKNLNENELCCLIEICPRGLGDSQDKYPIMPFLPVEAAHIWVKIHEKPKPKIILGADEPKLSVQQIQKAQLPIDKLVYAPNAAELYMGGQWCTVCEYFLHFVQEAMASPANEDKVKRIVAHTCDKLPTSVQGQCHGFVEMYGDALIALLIQDIDPSQICPHLYVCPSVGRDFEVFSPETVSVIEQRPIRVQINADRKRGDETCPLCLFAVQEALERVKSDKSTDNIKRTLAGLCSHLPRRLLLECTDFVETYTAELLHMLATDFTPQQICVYMKVCKDKKLDIPITLYIEGDGDIFTNEIPDNTVNGISMTHVNEDYELSPNCMLCEQVVKEVLKRVQENKTKRAIKDALEHSCEKLHKLRNKCTAIVEQYGDRIIDLIMKEMTPKEVCRELGMCVSSSSDFQTDEALVVSVVAIPSRPVLNDDLILTTGDQPTDVPSCMICKLVMTRLEVVLRDKKTDKEIEDTVKNICHIMPKREADECRQLIDKYGDLIISLVGTVPPREICSQMMLCSAVQEQQIVDLIVSDKPTCVICEFIMVQLEKELSDKSTQKEIEDTVKNICKKMPKSVGDQCNKFVDQYGALVLELLATASPKEICAQAQLCSAKLVLNETIAEVTECAVCHAATQAMAKYLDDPKNVRDVEHAIERTCNSLPGKYNGKCVSLIEIYGQSIINIITENGALDTVCSRIGMCFADEYESFVRIGEQKN